MQQQIKAWRIGVDIGGTFTDLVLVSAQGDMEVLKVPTVASDPSAGALNALHEVAKRKSLSLQDLLVRCTLFVHGTTVATNIVLERKGAKVGLLTTDGFRDALEIRRGLRKNPWNHRTPFPAPLVPRYLRFPVRGRIDKGGNVFTPLNVSDVRDAVKTMKQEGVEVVTVALFNSYINAEHEQESAAVIQQVAPELMVSISSNVAPIMGEFERTSTAVLNAYVLPKTLTYLQAFNKELVHNGLESPLTITQSNGGSVSIEELGDRPVNLLLSGPSSGVGALRYYRDQVDSSNLVSIEIGGTSCDVILMADGQFATIDVLDIGGFACVSPSIDVHTIGAGGGTIAHIDSGKLLQVGPQGAGAVPGPACYGLGGTEPTITDAQVVLGRLKPGVYADGAVCIDQSLAIDSIRKRIAEPLGISVEKAAAGIIKLLEQKLLHAVERVSTERGHDPAKFTLVAGGGGGPLHAAAIGRDIGCKRVFIPRLSGVFCALGMLNTDIQHDYFSVFLADLDEVESELLLERYTVLEEKARATLKKQGLAKDDMVLFRSLDLRYYGQMWDVTVPIEKGFDPAEIRRVFEAEHQRLYGHTQPDGLIEITKIRIKAIGKLPGLPMPATLDRPLANKPFEVRQVWVDEEGGWAEIPVYEGSTLSVDQTIVGPALVQEQTTTIFFGQNDCLTVDKSGNYTIEIR